MNQDQARFVLRTANGDDVSDVHVRALYTLLLAAEDRIRALERQAERPADTGIRYAYDHGRSIRDIATSHFMTERAVRESLARTFTPPGATEADACPACGQTRCHCGPGSAA